MGLTKARKAKKLLNKYAPKGEKLAYINDKEAKLLKSMGGAGIDINGTGIKSYIDFGYGAGSVSESLGGGSSSSSSSSSSSDSGGEGVYDPPAQSYTPAPEPEYDTADFAFTTPSPEPELDTLGEDQEEDVARMMIDMGIIADNAPIGFTPTTEEDDGDTGESLYVTPTLGEDQEEDVARMMVNMGLISGNTSGPNYVTAEELSNLNKGIGDLDEQAATLAKIQAVNPIEEKTGFFDSGIGKLIKTTAAVAAPALAPKLLPAVAAKPYTTYRKARTVANLANKFGLTDRTLPTLTELAKNIPQGTGNKVPNVATGYEGDGDNRPIPKDVVTASVQKYSPKFNPEQINRAITLRDQLQSYSETGRLNEKGQLTLQQLNNLIEQYQVSV